MKIVREDQWETSDNIILETAANEAVRTVSNLLVVAGPGAGKTELLAQKAGYLLETNLCAYPQKILAISFKKDAAENLKKRVVQRFGIEADSRFISFTYDAFAKNILDRFHFALPEDCRPEFDYVINDTEIIDTVFKSLGYKKAYGEKASATKAYYEKVIESVTLPLQDDGFGAKVWKKLLTGFDGNKACLTFKMISMLAIYIVQSNEMLKRAMQVTYSHVFLDEFQDTTSLQYDLVKTCFLGSSSLLTAVGDNKQRIMLWAGARKSIFTDFYNDFSAVGKRLVMNHRSAPRLVELQKAMYDSLNDKQCRVEAASKWEPSDGDIKLLITSDNNKEKDYLATAIRKQIDSGIKPNEICVLCKQKPQDYTADLIVELSDRGIKARVETEYQDLIREPIVEVVLSFLRLAMNRRHPDEWVSLTNIICGLQGIDDFPDGSNSYYLQIEQTEAMIKQISGETVALKSIQQLKAIIDEIIDYLGKDKIKAHFVVYSQGQYFEEIISKFIKMFWEELRETKFDWSLSVDNFIGMNSIPIMTIHKSKGLEYTAVYFIGLEDGAFWNFSKQPEEDRCAFFVALSRAKKHITFTYSNYRKGMQYPRQNHYHINEFFTLLQKPGMADVIEL